MRWPITGRAVDSPTQPVVPRANTRLACSGSRLAGYRRRLTRCGGRLAPPTGDSRGLAVDSRAVSSRLARHRRRSRLQQSTRASEQSTRAASRSTRPIQPAARALQQPPRVARLPIRMRWRSTHPPPRVVRVLRQPTRTLRPPARAARPVVQTTTIGPRRGPAGPRHAGPDRPAAGIDAADLTPETTGAVKVTGPIEMAATPRSRPPQPTSLVSASRTVAPPPRSGRRRVDRPPRRLPRPTR